MKLLKLSIFIIIVASGLFSCSYFTPNKDDKNEPKVIDFTSVDAYPLLPECEQMSSRAMQKKCFNMLLSKQIEVSLKKVNLNNKIFKNDTIYIKIQVSNTGFIQVSDMEQHRESLENSIVIKQLINQTLAGISPIKPAIKMGIPVTTEFTLPVILEKNK